MHDSQEAVHKLRKPSWGIDCHLISSWWTFLCFLICVGLFLLRVASELERARWFTSLEEVQFFFAMSFRTTNQGTALDSTVTRNCDWCDRLIVKPLIVIGQNNSFEFTFQTDMPFFWVVDFSNSRFQQDSEKRREKMNSEMMDSEIKMANEEFIKVSKQVSLWTVVNLVYLVELHSNRPFAALWDRKKWKIASFYFFSKCFSCSPASNNMEVLLPRLGFSRGKRDNPGNQVGRSVPRE